MPESSKNLTMNCQVQSPSLLSIWYVYKPARSFPLTAENIYNISNYCFRTPVERQRFTTTPFELWKVLETGEEIFHGTYQLPAHSPMDNTVIGFSTPKVMYIYPNFFATGNEVDHYFDGPPSSETLRITKEDRMQMHIERVLKLEHMNCS